MSDAEKYDALYRFLVSWMFKQKLRELQEDIVKKIDNFTSFAMTLEGELSNSTYQEGSDSFNLVARDPIKIVNNMTEMASGTNFTDVDNTTLTIGSGTSFFSISGASAFYVIIILVILAIIITVVLVYCYGVKKGKLKHRLNQSIHFAPNFPIQILVQPPFFTDVGDFDQIVSIPAQASRSEDQADPNFTVPKKVKFKHGEKRQ